MNVLHAVRKFQEQYPGKPEPLEAVPRGPHTSGWDTVTLCLANDSVRCTMLHCWEKQERSDVTERKTGWEMPRWCEVMVRW